MLIQYLLIAIIAAALWLTWRRERQGALSRGGAMLWSALWVLAVVVVLRPSVATSFASVVGVGRGVDAVLYLSVLLLFYLVFRVFLRLDKIDRDITKLVRRMGLDEAGAADRKDDERKEA